MNNNSREVRAINTNIIQLNNIDNKEERLMKIFELEEKISSISNKNKIKLNILNEEAQETSLSLKQYVDWGNSLNKDKNYYKLSDYIVFDNITKMDIHKEHFGDEMWTSKNKKLIESFTEIINVPYIDFLNDDYTDFMNTNEVKDGDYSNYIYVTLYDVYDNLIYVGIYLSGYVTIHISHNDGPHKIVSLIRLNREKVEALFSDDVLSSQANLSLYSYLVQEYNYAMNAWSGPALKLNYPNAIFECTIDKGLLNSTRGNDKNCCFSSCEIVEWAPIEIENYGTSDQKYVDAIVSINEKAYMDVFIIIDDEIVGYIVFEMVRIDHFNYRINEIGSDIFKDENDIYIKVTREYVLNIINKLKGIGHEK